MIPGIVSDQTIIYNQSNLPQQALCNTVHKRKHKITIYFYEHIYPCGIYCQPPHIDIFFDLKIAAHILNYETVIPDNFINGETNINIINISNFDDLSVITVEYKYRSYIQFFSENIIFVITIENYSITEVFIERK
jgi:hypothetical protein